MKTTIKIIALSTLGFTTLCYANEPQETSLLTDMFSKSHFDKDFSASVGLRLWENKWSLPRWDFNAQDPNTPLVTQKRSDVIISNTSDNKLVTIPNIGLRYKNFYLGGSYFNETTYNTKEQYKVLGNYGYKLGYKPKRSELDINGGYYLNKNLMITLGYKIIDRLYSEEVFSDTGIKSSSSGYDSKGKGAIIGISANAPMGNTGFNLYGNLSYGRLKTNESVVYISSDFNYSRRYNYNNNYYSGEFGVSYAIPFKDNYFSAISMSLGYRFQRYEFKNVLSPDIAQTAVDTTDGFVAGINILF